MRLIQILLFLFGTSLCAQPNWQPGFIIQNGEKIEGEIDDREWPYYIERFKFRSSPAGSVTVYSSTDEVSFGVADRRYEVKGIGYITNSRELDNLTRDTILQRKATRGFLRQYFTGEMSLFQFVDPTGKRHFYLQRNDGPLIYLEYELRLRENSDKKIVRYVDNYKYQLVQSLKDCPTLSSQITEADYTLSKLSKIVKAWYICQQITPDFIAKTNHGTISIGGMISFLRTSSIGHDEESGEITNEEHGGVAPGIALRYVFPGARQKYGLKLEGFYHSFDDVARVQTRQDNSITKITRRDFSAATIKIHLLTEMAFLTSKTSGYLEGGVVASYLLDSDQTQTQISISPDGTQSILIENLNVQANMSNEIGWLVGAGFRRNSLQLGIRASRVARLKGNSGIGFYRAGVIAGYWF